MKGKRMPEHHHKNNYEPDPELERFMAMSWGTPEGLSKLMLSVSAFIISIGVFLWLLHLANIIR